MTFTLDDFVLKYNNKIVVFSDIKEAKKFLNKNYKEILNDNDNIIKIFIKDNKYLDKIDDKIVFNRYNFNPENLELNLDVYGHTDLFDIKQIVNFFDINIKVNTKELFNLFILFNKYKPSTKIINFMQNIDKYRPSENIIKSLNNLENELDMYKQKNNNIEDFFKIYQRKYLNDILKYTKNIKPVYEILIELNKKYNIKLDTSMPQIFYLLFQDNIAAENFIKLYGKQINYSLSFIS
jgi:hypothetical protein